MCLLLQLQPLSLLEMIDLFPFLNHIVYALYDNVLNELLERMRI